MEESKPKVEGNEKILLWKVERLLRRSNIKDETPISDRGRRPTAPQT